MKRTQIHLPELSVEKLEALAKSQGITVAELIRFIIWQYLEKTK